jgi:hypothetical protein
MNENSNNQGSSFFTDLIKDDGIQRAAAGVVVAVVVAVAKNVIFGKVG